jgi:hypothetical protein
MTKSPSATTARDLAILLLDPERGRFPTHQHPDILYSGALLLDLLSAGRIRISGTGKQATIEVVDSAPLGDPVLDDELKAQELGLGGRKLTTAIGRSSLILMLRALASEGSVDIEETKKLGLVTVTRYHPLPASGRDDLVAQVRRVLAGEQVPDRRTGLLATMLGRDQRRWVPKEHRKDAPQRVQAFAQSDAVTDDEREVIDAMLTAIMKKNDDSGRI